MSRVTGTILRDRLVDDVLRIVRRASKERSVVERVDIVAKLTSRDWCLNDFPEGLERAVSKALRHHRQHGRMEYKRRLRLGWRENW